MYNTGHRAFDRLANKSGILAGCVWGDAQLSIVIRSHCETHSNGFICLPGRLQAFDLKPFKELPPGVLLAIRKSAKDDAVILYKFRHFAGNDGSGHANEIIHGYIITRPNPNGRDLLLHRFITNVSRKSRDIIQAMCIEVGDGLHPH